MKVVIIQRACADFRIGFFDLLEKKTPFKLISKKSDLGKVKVPNSLKRSHFYKSKYFNYKDYIFFPFLIFDLLKISPDVVVTEGGQNTINNLTVLLYSKIKRSKYFIWDLGKLYMEENNSFAKDL